MFGKQACKCHGLSGFYGERRLRKLKGKTPCRLGRGSGLICTGWGLLRTSASFGSRNTSSSIAQGRRQIMGPKGAKVSAKSSAR